MKRSGLFFVAVTFMLLAFASCKSTDIESRPLWTDSNTIGQVFPSEEYVTGIGRSQTADAAMNLADGNLASYFSREIISVTSAQTVIASDDSGAGSESLLRDVTVVSEQALSGVEHTNPWFDKKNKIWYVCSYLNRKDAWKNYEPVLKQEKTNFYSFIDSAEKEEDPFKRIAYLNSAKTAGESYNKSILFAELLYKKGCSVYSEDRTVLASLDEKLSSIAMNISYQVQLMNGTDSRYKAVVEKIITESGFSVTSDKADYDVCVLVDEQKQKFEDTIVSNPEIKIEIKNKAYTYITWKKNMDRITGFAEAERLLDTKISRAVDKVLESEFAPVFSASMK